jgi:hypothetical protein
MGKSNHQWYIERNDDGKYTATKGGAERASAVRGTQAEAIERAREIDSRAPIHVERVRHTDQGTPDEWRKPQHWDLIEDFGLKTSGLTFVADHSGRFERRRPVGARGKKNVEWLLRVLETGASTSDWRRRRTSKCTSSRRNWPSRRIANSSRP